MGVADFNAGDHIARVYIEIPAGSQNKYEYDEEGGYFYLDRVLYSSHHYPAEYGFIPETLAEDGDPVDILVLASNPTFPGCVIEARIIGALEMSDEKGLDLKIISVSNRDPRYKEINELSDLPSHTILEIENFFETYKDLENKVTEIIGWRDKEYAVRMIEEGKRRYREQRFGG